MSAVKRSPQFDSTGSSLDSYEDVNTVKIKTSIKELLKSRIFLGRYIERRLIDERIGYRDIVVVSPAESELKRDLAEASHKLRTLCSATHWIGITDTEALGLNPSSVCLWTEIDNQPFGPFWFQIKSLRFRDLEIIVTIKCLRHITDAFLEMEPILTGASKNNETIERKIEHPIEILNETCQDIKASLKSALSITNVKEFFTFIFAFVIAIFTGSTAFVNFLGNFILALIRETSILVKNSTPMFLGFLDFLSKIVGGFYILLAMFFKPSNTPLHNKRTLTYNNYRQSPQSHDVDSRFID